MASDITIAILPARAAEVPSNQGNRLERINGDRYTVNFTSTSNQTCVWTIPVLPQLFEYHDGTRSPKLRLNCIANTTTGDVDFDVAYEYNNPLDLTDLDSFASWNSAGSIDNSTLPPKAGRMFQVEHTLSPFSWGNVGEGQNFRLRLTRDAASDTANGTVKVLGAEFLIECNEFNLTTFDRVHLPNVANCCQGRLTLASGDAVPSADQNSKSTLYFTPYKGNKVSLYDGTIWQTHSFSEISLSLGTMTTNLPYDVFLYNLSGTLTLERVAWTNGTTRATNITLQNGVYVKSGSTAYRYLGTFYTDGPTTTTDSKATRLLWNYYNQVYREIHQAATGTTATYSTATTYRAAGGDNNVRHSLVCGLAGMGNLIVVGNNKWYANTIQACQSAFGLDSTTSAWSKSTVVMQHNASLGGNYWFNCTPGAAGDVGLGFHYIQLLDYQNTTATTTWGPGELRGLYQC